MPAAPGPGLVVLDFDGTLADSFGWFCSVLNGVADRYRFRRVEAHEVEELQAKQRAQGLDDTDKYEMRELLKALAAL